MAPAQKVRRLESVYDDTNGVPRSQGRLTHLGLADGELASKIVVVGANSRAELLAGLLEPVEPDGKVFRLSSDRGFITYTGRYAGERVSVVAAGMGLAMMDFFVREARAVVNGPMAIVRFGTCGGLQAAQGAGGIAVASKGAVGVRRNFDAFADGVDRKPGNPYLVSSICPADGPLSEAVLVEMKKDLGDNRVHAGINATADSFYGSQGRRDRNFVDENEDLVDDLAKDPDMISMEMETFMLFHLAQCSRPRNSVRAAAAAVIVANRATGDVVDADTLRNLEREGGESILRALAGFALDPAAAA